MPDWLAAALAAGASSFAACWVALQVKLAVLTVRVDHVERDVEAAHRRMDSHSIPPAGAMHQ